MLIMTSTGLAVLSFSLLLAVDLQWSLIRGKRLYNSKWSYKAVIVGLWHPLLIGREARGNHTATLWTRSSTVAQLVVEQKEETDIACRRTRKTRESGRRSGGSLSNKCRKEKGAPGKAPL
ncbi:uncharacterized protein LOC141946257 isoform X3 [Strix uralensis]|uniref:uncharacterized protein LOC141946257 isoform X3 n=1 Tax=Strix uralensis TaxID=36305 RepID=UPI003DA749EC